METTGIRLIIMSIILITFINLIVVLSDARINPSNCVGAWLFDEGEENKAIDSSGKGHDGTITGATWVEGKFGKALEFDGADDVVIVPDGGKSHTIHFYSCGMV